MGFQFRGPNGTDVRPVNVSGAKLWAKGPSAPGARDGTVWDPYLVNEIVGNLRGLLDAYEITGADSDDTRITQAVEAAAAAAVDASLDGYQPLDATLTAFAGLAIAADKLPYGNGSNTFALADFSAFARTLLDDADAATARSTLGAAPSASPAFSGTPTAPTASPGTNTSQVATTAFVAAAVASLLNSAPGALDTLDELAAALGDDANFASTITTALAGKQPLDATLTALAGLTIAADKLPYGTGTDAFALADFSAFARTLLDDADAATMRATLGLGTAATQAYGTSANQLVRLDGTGKLPAVDGSQLTNLPSGGGSPGGSADGQVQYKSGSSFAAFAGVAIATSGDLLSLIAQAATDVPLVLKMHASQSANPFELRNSANAVKAGVTKDGYWFPTSSYNVAGYRFGSAINTGFGSGSTDLIQVMTHNGGTFLILSHGETGFASGVYLGWQSGASLGNGTTLDLILGRKAAANLRFGKADAASPVAQTLSFQGAAGGNNNVAGAVATVDLSPSTGSALGGGLKIRGTNAGSSGTSQNSYSDWAEIVAGGGIKGYGVIESTTGGIKWPDGVTLSGVATAAQYRAKTANKALSTDLVWAAVDMVALTDGATITPDFAAGINFTVTLGGNRTLANPSNLTPGQSGVIVVSQDATGSRTLAYGSQWKFPGGAPTLSTGANKIDVISYFVQSTSIIRAVLTKDYS